MSSVLREVNKNNSCYEVNGVEIRVLERSVFISCFSLLETNATSIEKHFISNLKLLYLVSPQAPHPRLIRLYEALAVPKRFFVIFLLTKI